MATLTEMLSGKVVYPSRDETPAELAYTAEERAALDEKASAIEARLKAERKIGKILGQLQESSRTTSDRAFDAFGRAPKKPQKPKNQDRLETELKAAQAEHAETLEREQEARSHANKLMRSRSRRLRTASAERSLKRA